MTRAPLQHEAAAGAAPSGAPVLEVDLDVGGMTCASCVGRVERKLAKVPGASATVNLALESAHVVVDRDCDPADLVKAVESAGYEARVVRVRQLDGAADAEARHVAAGHTHAAGVDHEAGDHADLAMAGASEHLFHGPEVTKARLITAAVATVPIAVLSMVPTLQFDGWQWVVAALSLPVVTWAAWPFHRAAFKAARHGASTMDTLVSLGIIAATGWSLWALLFGGAGEIGMRMHATLLPRAGGHDAMPELYFEVAAVVTTFLLAGRYAEARAKSRSSDALRALLSLGAKEASVLVEGPDGVRRERRVPIDQVAVGDLVAVRPGEKVATDGEVVEGHSAIDASLVTGEAMPVEVGPHDSVIGATVNTSGYLVVRATRVGEETMLAAMGRLVTAAQTGKAPVQRLADRISAVFVPIVIGIALVTLVAWLIGGAGAQTAFTAAVAVLIIACPCALGLATPTALLVGTGRGAQLGILIKGPQILESTRRIDTVVLDKTGTLTEGALHVVSVTVPGAPREMDGRAGGVSSLADGEAPLSFPPTSAEADVLALAAAVESRSEHPVAAAIVRAAGQGEGLAEVTGFAAEPGYGVRGEVHQGETVRTVLAGRPELLTSAGLTIPSELEQAFARAGGRGATGVMVGWDGAARGVIALADTPRASASAAIAELRGMGLAPMLLTGDNARAAEAVAGSVGIATADVLAEVLPAQKAAQVARLREGGAVVAMVGDGVNDAPALAGADLGIAMGSGTDVAMQASDITIVRGDLEAVPQAIRLSRATLRIIKQNLFWAFAYNVAAIPLAAAGLLNPMISGLAMAASSVLVVGNSLRLRHFR